MLASPPPTNSPVLASSPAPQLSVQASSVKLTGAAPSPSRPTRSAGYTETIQDKQDSSSPLLRWLSTIEYWQREQMVRNTEDHSDKSEDHRQTTPDTVVLPSQPTQVEKEIKADSNPLSSLKPPPVPCNLYPSRNLKKEHLNLIKPVVSLLVLDLTNA